MGASFPHFSRLPLEIQLMVWRVSAFLNIVYLELDVHKSLYCSRVWAEMTFDGPNCAGLFDLDHQSEEAQEGQGADPLWALRTRDPPPLFKNLQRIISHCTGGLHQILWNLLRGTFKLVKLRLRHIVPGLGQDSPRKRWMMLREPFGPATSNSTFGPIILVMISRASESWRCITERTPEIAVSVPRTICRLATGMTTSWQPLET